MIPPCPFLTSWLRRAALLGFLLFGVAYSQEPAKGSLQGIVSDQRSRPMSGATVSLSMGKVQGKTTQTDSEGKYRFADLEPGDYIVRAVLPGVGQMRTQVKIPGAAHVDLKLQSDSALPEFSDDPKFTVAGITDASSAGSHGSSATAPATEALARATVELGKKFEPASSGDETRLKEAANRQPENFEANQKAGIELARAGKAIEAQVYLRRASNLTAPNSQQAEVHHLLGSVLEQLHNPLEAVLEYQRAAELNPN